MTAEKKKPNIGWYCFRR